MTPEQQARDMMERAGWDGAQSCSAGDLVEIANLIERSGEISDLTEALHGALTAIQWQNDIIEGRRKVADEFDPLTIPDPDPEGSAARLKAIAHSGAAACHYMDSIYNRAASVDSGRRETRLFNEVERLRALLATKDRALDLAVRYVALQNAPWAAYVQQEDLATVRAALSAADRDSATPP